MKTGGGQGEGRDREERRGVKAMKLAVAAVAVAGSGDGGMGRAAPRSLGGGRPYTGWLWNASRRVRTAKGGVKFRGRERRVGRICTDRREKTM